MLPVLEIHLKTALAVGAHAMAALEGTALQIVVLNLPAYHKYQEAFQTWASSVLTSGQSEVQSWNLYISKLPLISGSTIQMTVFYIRREKFRFSQVFFDSASPWRRETSLSPIKRDFQNTRSYNSGSVTNWHSPFIPGREELKYPSLETRN